MYLKTLILKGFKSFPDQTVIPFGKAVSAIVGPNGSGKSNLSDAILWVMGEQSTKALRGGKMEDVIFSGARKRSAVGFAEVSLILDNEDRAIPMDAGEIMVTRRYYRSGESEYYLNRKPVRLKDVHELFMDTGLGREGYSIISQGKVDEILAAKSGERREIFEEAAGISRFRHRKEEAERNLQRTKDNLLRVGDKIAELELQVKPLKQQAALAKQYLGFKNELKSLEVSVWMEDLERLQTADRKTERDLALAVSRRERLSGQTEELYAALESLNRRMQELEKQAEDARRQKARLETERAEASHQITACQANAKHYLENEARIRQEIMERKMRAESLENQAGQKRMRLLELQRETDGLRQTLDVLVRQSEERLQSAGSAGRDLEALRQEAAETASMAAEEKARLSALAASAKELNDRASALAALEGERSDALCQAEQKQRELAKTMEEAEKSSAVSANVLDGNALRLAAREKRAAEEAEAYRELEREKSALSARLSVLSEMEETFEGYSKAVRIVMEEAGRGNLSGILGPVANLIKTEDAYTAAMEIALGSALQHIVVEREESGKNAILFLKRRDAGRATFLPLTSVRGRALKEPDMERQPGFVGIAAALVSCEDRYREIIWNLLGRTVLAENLDAAVCMGQQFGFRFRIVTLDGQVVYPGGALAGGSIRRSAGILSRSGEIARLSRQENERREKLGAARKKWETAKREAEQARYDLNLSRDQKQQAEQALLQLQEEEKHLVQLAADLRRRKNKCQAEWDGVKARIAATDEKMEAARLTLAELEARGNALERKRQKTLEGQTSLQAEASSLGGDAAGKRASLASLEAEAAAIEKSLSEFSALGQVFFQEQKRLEERMENGRKQQRAILEEQAKWKRSIHQTDAEINSRETALKELGRERLELEEKRTCWNRESQEAGKSLLSIERECAVLEQRRVSFQAEEVGILDKLWDSYALCHSAAVSLKEKLPGLIRAKSRIAELKRELSVLGTPN
ncbi:MAG: chromosome segregation protein SMC, partial [Oscillospiraceae bacterium]|nr:chromosome segregation protein SMC [Oscillospiraceae bacterium]